MRKPCELVFLSSIFTAIGLAGQMSGYISDAACGWNNARAEKEAKECAQKCVKAGWDPVFVRDGQMDVLKVSDKAKALPYVGDHVIVDGAIKGGTLLMNTIRRTPNPPRVPRKSSKLG